VNCRCPIYRPLGSSGLRGDLVGGLARSPFGASLGITPGGLGASSDVLEGGAFELSHPGKKNSRETARIHILTIFHLRRGSLVEELYTKASPLGHLITLSARASTFGGIVRPICFAAFKLITSSNFVGCSTGRSAGLVPFRILSTNTATRL
jgi:hypothetical protein